MLNSHGTAYAAPATGKIAESSIPSRFVLWFNGNGIPERYWIPAETGPGYALTPFCLLATRTVSEGFSRHQRSG